MNERHEDASAFVPRITRDLMSLLMHKKCIVVRRTHRSWPKIHLHRRTIYFDYYRFTGYACLPISNLRNSFTTHTHTLPDDLHEWSEKIMVWNEQKTELNSLKMIFRSLCRSIPCDDQIHSNRMHIAHIVPLPSCRPYRRRSTLTIFFLLENVFLNFIDIFQIVHHIKCGIVIASSGQSSRVSSALWNSKGNWMRRRYSFVI